MRRVPIAERPGWREAAAARGFHYAHADGVPYWDETACFALTLDQVERDLEVPTDELHAMALDLAGRAVADEALMARLRVPRAFWDYVAASWHDRDPSIIGRFDLAYDGTGPARLLEYNADTPTSLYEAGVFQWEWLEEGVASTLLPQGTDQFNAIHDRLIAAYARLAGDPSLMHFACEMASVEDFGNIAYLMDCASQAGLRPKFIDIALVGLDAKNRFADQDNLVIDRLTKLAPWEWMFRSDYADVIHASGTRFFEPAWKAILSSKAILPVLWQLHEGHPNLLPAYFEDDPRAASLGDRVRKPIFSREGANTTLVLGGKPVQETGGTYGEEGFVVQAAAPLFASAAGYAVVGSWVIGAEAAGIGIREDSGPVTRNLSRFVPHVISGEAWTPEGTVRTGEGRPGPAVAAAAAGSGSVT